MSRTGFARPGALQMSASLVLMALSGIGPLFIATTRPGHEWMVILTGLPVLGVSLFGIGILLLYVVGFLRYCGSKGYSKWLGAWLLLGNVFGFIVLLLLPDLTTVKTGAGNGMIKNQETTASR